MRSRDILVVVLLLVAARPVTAQEPLPAPAPLLPDTTPSASAGDNVVTLEAAQRAQDMGFPSAAAALYRQLLDASPSSAGQDRSVLTLGLATALLDEGQAADALKTLEALPAPRAHAWHLRAALAYAQLKQYPESHNQGSVVKESELSAADKSWYLFLRGVLTEADGDHNKAKEFFEQAANSAVSAQARARFLLKREQARLRTGAPVAADELERMRRNVEQFRGKPVGYGFVQAYAIMLDSVGRRNEAIGELRHELLTMRAEERGPADEIGLLLGLIASANDGDGRNALERLLERGSDRDKQRIALQLLARASTRNPQLTAFRHELDALIAARSTHPLLEDLLLFRAQVALATARVEHTTEGYTQAEEDARTFLEKFPGSPLKAHAYGILTDSAWEQRRYRTAADNAAKARAELPAGPARASLGVLVAEAWFRAHDYRSAADAYAAAVREPPAGITPGELMFQRVLAEIELGEPAAAANLLDELSRDPAFDPVNRWQAEWNLARALQVRGKTPEAFARVSRLLGSAAGEVAALPVDLRARMAWLQVRLSAAAGNSEQALRLVDGLAGSVVGAAPELRAEISSSGELMRAEAQFALGRDALALDVLKNLRANFPRSDAAVYSYFDEAEHYAKQDKTVEAQQLLTKLAEDFPRHRYAPLALYQAAIQAERRGQEANYREANRLIEDLVNKYPQDPLVFAARLKQGDLLRKYNDFAAAQRVYEELVNKFPGHADVALAQLALAETHNAQARDEPAHAESAILLFEHVRDRIDAPLDARIEAGFNLGLIRSRRGEFDKAQDLWWRDVVDTFLLKPENSTQLGAKGRYWMTRTLIELGALYEQQEKLEEAKRAWSLILTAKLGYGEALAKARLARFNVADAK